MAEKRPKIKLKLAFKDKAIEILGWLSIFAVWVICINSYPELPNIIPIHYDASGTADGFGDKCNIFTLPIVATILFISLTILNKYPHIFNYPTEITQKNAEKQYAIATSMIRYLKLSIAIIFGSIAINAVRNATGETDGLGTWFLPLILALLFLPVFYYLIKSSKNS